MKKIWLLFALVSIAYVSNSQIITTYAGNGSLSHTGDGGDAIMAGIGEPHACAFDASGNFYFSDILANVIRRITPCGIISTVAGTGIAGYNGDGILATDAKLNEPEGIAFDSIGNLYIGDVLNNRIRKIDVITGIINTISGNGTAGFGGDAGLAIDAILNEPASICFDSYGNLYIVDAANERIRKINASGIISTFAGTGIAGYSGDSSHADSAEIENVDGICSDPVGNIFFGQLGIARVRKISTAGIITTFAGNGSAGTSGDGGPAIDAGLNPFSLSFDNSGSLYISGYIENNVRKINDTGIITTVAGNGVAGFTGDGGPADSAELNQTRGIALDHFGNLYIADIQNHRIRKVTFNPVVIPTITVTIAANTGDTICSGTPVIYTASVSGSGTTSFTYQWLVNGNPAADITNIYTYIPTNGDSVRCVLSVAGICYTPSSNEINMVVIPAATPTITLSGPATAAMGSTVTVTATITGAGSSYDIKWYDNGILFATTTAPMVAYTMTAGTNLITATVLSTSPGCYDTATSAAHSITSANTGIMNLGSQSVSFYPNPAHDELLITGSDISKVTISNAIGQSLLNKDSNADKVNIDISTLQPGVYLVHVIQNDGVQVINKIIKE